MMYLIKYNKDEHFTTVTDWLKARKSYAPGADEIPELGYLVYDRGTPFAVGFLRRCEGNFAIFDGLATDPGADPEQRNAGLDLVVEQLIKTAKELELKGIVAWSRDNFTLMRSFKHGFKQLPEIVIGLDLTS